MAYSTPEIVQRPQFQVVGFSIVTTLNQAWQQGTVKQMEHLFLDRKGEVTNRSGDETYLVQLYPLSGHFDADTPFTVIVGARVEGEGQVPEGMIRHTVPAGGYVMVTHHGPEFDLNQTYPYIYGDWIPKTGRRPLGFDYEVWDERYKPESPENQIDIYVAVK